jgi:hypothetical protein
MPGLYTDSALRRLGGPGKRRRTPALPWIAAVVMHVDCINGGRRWSGFHGGMMQSSCISRTV